MAGDTGVMDLSACLHLIVYGDQIGGSWRPLSGFRESNKIGSGMVLRISFFSISPLLFSDPLPELSCIPISAVLYPALLSLG